MIRELFTWLSNLLYVTPFLAVIATFIWGILSILLSPCHLTSIPLVISFINEQKELTTRKAFRFSLLFSLGILLTISLIGIITASLGRLMGDLGGWGNYIVSIIFIIIGLYLLDIISMPGGGIGGNLVKGKGYWAALSLGLIFGIALGPCTFAYMAPILGVVFNVSSRNIIYGISLLLTYAIGHCLVIVMAGTLFEQVKEYLNWTRKSKTALILRKVCGVLVLAGGIYLIYTAA